MNFSARCPPDTLTLSDIMIGNVIPRAQVCHHNSSDNNGWRVTGNLGFILQQPKRRTYLAVHKKYVHPATLDAPQHHINTVKPSLSPVINTHVSTDRKRKPCVLSELHTTKQSITSIQEAAYAVTDEFKRVIVAEVLKNRIRHRERCRTAQVRYRNKQLKIKKDIEDAISKLNGEIEVLEARRRKYSHFITSPTMWAKSAEYIRYFNCYALSPETLHPAALNFLSDIMSPNVTIGSHVGVEMQLENWKLLAFYFDGVQVDLIDMNMLASNTLVVHTNTSITITSDTLSRAFPNLSGAAVGGLRQGSWSRLAATILDQTLLMRGSVVLEWDNATDKVVRVHFQADMMTPLIKLLGDMKDVNSVFNKARVTPDFRIVRSVH